MSGGTGERGLTLSGQPTIEEFRDECHRWLDENAQRRTDSRREFKWGEGSDAVALFHSLTSEEERSLLEEARRWEQLKADVGLGSITWEPKYGGLGLPMAFEQIYRAEEARYVTPVGHELMVISRNLVAATIRKVGSSEQKNRFVKALRRSDLLACQMFSEPGAGSDLASVATRAERDGDAWRLTGQKVWTSGAQFADWGYVLCRSANMSERHQGITAFLVPLTAPGVEVRPLRQMTGGSSFNEVFLDGVRVTDDLRLGEVGEGWRVAKTTLGFERAPTASAKRVGAGWSQVLALAHHVGVSDDPHARQLLARLYTSMQVLRWSSKRSLASLRQGQTPGPEGSTAKLAWSIQLQLLSEVVSHLLGPSLVADTGEWGTYSWSEHVAGAPGYRIAGGSDEIQRNIIGERVLGLPPEPRPS